MSVTQSKGQQASLVQAMGSHPGQKEMRQESRFQEPKADDFPAAAMPEQVRAAVSKEQACTAKVIAAIKRRLAELGLRYGDPAAGVSRWMFSSMARP